MYTNTFENCVKFSIITSLTHQRDKNAQIGYFDLSTAKQEMIKYLRISINEQHLLNDEMVRKYKSSIVTDEMVIYHFNNAFSMYYKYDYTGDHYIDQNTKEIIIRNLIYYQTMMKKCLNYSVCANKACKMICPKCAKFSGFLANPCYKGSLIEVKQIFQTRRLNALEINNATKYCRDIKTYQLLIGDVRYFPINFIKSFNSSNKMHIYLFQHYLISKWLLEAIFIGVQELVQLTMPMGSNFYYNKFGELYDPNKWSISIYEAVNLGVINKYRDQITWKMEKVPSELDIELPFQTIDKNSPLSKDLPIIADINKLIRDNKLPIVWSVVCFLSYGDKVIARLFEDWKIRKLSQRDHNLLKLFNCSAASDRIINILYPRSI